MGRPMGPKKVHRYSMEFKLTAVKLSGMPGVQVQTVANALDIHPFMLSRWRKEVRDGMLRGRARRVEVGPRRELKRLQMLEREHATPSRTWSPPQLTQVETVVDQHARQRPPVARLDDERVAAAARAEAADAEHTALRASGAARSAG